MKIKNEHLKFEDFYTVGTELEEEEQIRKTVNDYKTFRMKTKLRVLNRLRKNIFSTDI